MRKKQKQKHIPNRRGGGELEVWQKNKFSVMAKDGQ